jgi:hypothetical protein
MAGRMPSLPNMAANFPQSVSTALQSSCKGDVCSVNNECDKSSECNSSNCVSSVCRVSTDVKGRGANEYCTQDYQCGSGTCNKSQSKCATK